MGKTKKPKEKKEYVPTQRDLDNPCLVCKKVWEGNNTMLQCTVCGGWIHLKCSEYERTPKSLRKVVCAECVKKKEEGVDLQATIEDPEILTPLEDLEEEEEEEVADEDQPVTSSMIANLFKRFSEAMQIELDKRDEELQAVKNLLEKQSQEVKKKPNPFEDSFEAEAFSWKNSFMGESSRIETKTHKKPEKSAKPEEENPKEESSKKKSADKKDSSQESKEKNIKDTQSSRKGSENPPTDSESSEGETSDEDSDQEEENPKPQSKSISSPKIQRRKSTLRTSRTFAYLKKQELRPLPIFSGIEVDWPAFARAYAYSTEEAKFSDEENTTRLRDFLKGDAFTLVEGLLINPAGAPAAMDTLDQWYGDTIRIRNKLKEKLMDLPNPTERDPQSYRNFAAQLKTFVKYLEILKNSESLLANDDTIREILSKLSPGIQARWHDALNMSGRTPTLLTLDSFVTRIAISYKDVIFAAGSSGTRADKKPVKPTGPTKTNHKVFVHQDNQNSSGNKGNDDRAGAARKQPEPYCHLCEVTGHRLDDCPPFKQLSVEKRTELARKKVLCLTCLKKRHNWNQCRKNKDKANPQPHQLLKPPKEQEPPKGTVLSHYQKNGSNILFRIVPVTLHGYHKKIQTFAILDDCSSITLLEQSVADTLSLSPVEDAVPLKIQWTQNKIANLEANKYTLKISSRSPIANQFRLKNVYAISNLQLPEQSLDMEALRRNHPHLADLDIPSWNNARPTILIGLEHTKLGLPMQIKDGSFSEPVAMKTRLGWIVHGPSPSTNNSQVKHTLLMNHQEEENLEMLHDLVKYNFTTESFGIKPPGPTLESLNDMRAKELLEKFAVRKGNRFEAPLLWKEDEFEMPNSYEMAKSRLESLERKLLKNPELKRQYSEKISEYLEKGYAIKLEEKGVTKPRSHEWFLPHFPVQTPSKPKPRLVFDAAARVNKNSLNSFLLSGPDIYTNLVHVLLGMRLYKVAVIGDIAEMFHQVIIREEDRAAQQFLWRNCETEKPIEKFQMVRMIFGNTSSPFVAQWVKNKNAEEFEGTYPEACKAIRESHYVDDFVKSFQTEKEAIKISKDVIFVHQQAGFVLRGFVSNNSRVQQALNQTKENVLVNLDKDVQQIQTQKVLGLHWDPKEDVYIFKINVLDKFGEKIRQGITKRHFLSLLMSIFDPFGFLENYKVQGKMLLQDIWSSKIGWDEKLADQENQKFLRWIKDMENVEMFKLPRCLSEIIPEADEIEAHIFSDASDSAFACVAYLRVVKDGQAEICLIGAKTRVAPVKKRLSIPRLELQGFVLGVRWLRFLLDGLKEVKINKTFHWTDSKTVLSWVNSSSRKFNKFVENRVSEILEYLEENRSVELRYVPTNLNVADEATKYIGQVDVSPTSIWINGPEFLKKPVENWPQTIATTEAEEEICYTFLHNHNNQEKRLVEFSDYSSFGKLVRSIAWVIRFIENLKRRKSQEPLVLKPWPTAMELNTARLALIKQAQMEAYPKEVMLLKDGKQEVPRDSTLMRLNPIMKDGILRMDSRLSSGEEVNFNTKFPIILQKSHHFTWLLINEFHKQCAHQHNEMCVNEIRKSYWIPELRVCVKKVRARCQECKIRAAKPREPQMGNLPPERYAAFAHPFTYVGMDAFGPIYIAVNRSSQKRWVILYTCMTTRAVHLEIIHSLSTDSCIMAFRNFCNLRRKPHKVFCDNGRNFVGMDRELKQAFREWKMQANEINNKIICPTEAYQTEFLFNPPASPHMGGVWERLVRTVKNVFKILVKNVKLHEESLRCFMNEAMQIVNSRPLTYIPLEHGQAPALTPNHFLKLECPYDPPPGVFNESECFGRLQWKNVQQLINQFWRRWVKEVLPDLTRRTKWNLRSEPLKVGDLVIIIDENAERNTWSRGEVIKVFPDKKGQVRYADVRTTTGIYRRPTVKLAILDVR